MVARDSHLWLTRVRVGEGVDSRKREMSGRRAPEVQVPPDVVVADVGEREERSAGRESGEKQDDVLPVLRL